MNLIAIIIIFSIVQSLFGMGLLVFGTPALMLSGFNYSETLSYLLPSSLVISISQLYGQKYLFNIHTKRFLLFSIPPLIVTLFIVLNNNLDIEINKALACILIFFSLTNAFSVTSKKLKNIVSNYPIPILAIMGSVHGLTNLGGSVLSLYSSCQFEEKRAMRSFIAYCYLVFCTVQIIILIANGAFVYRVEALYFPLIAFFIYITLGRYGFNSTSNVLFLNLFNAFMFMFGVALLM